MFPVRPVPVAIVLAALYRNPGAQEPAAPATRQSQRGPRPFGAYLIEEENNEFMLKKR